MMNGFKGSRTPETIDPARPLQSLRTGHVAVPLLSLVCVVLTSGCIERTVTINTEPEGATVFLNDQEVGQSPLKVPFTWYGDYDIILRKKGYKTVHTHHRVTAPWYELPGLDIITECLIPFTVHDDRVLDTFVLGPAQPPSKEELLKAATDMKMLAGEDTR